MPLHSASSERKSGDCMQLPVSEDVTNEDLRKLLHCSQEGVRDPSYLLFYFALVVKELEKSRPNENWPKVIVNVALGQANLDRLTSSSYTLRLEVQDQLSIHSAKP
nr:hypothetical protein [uncultured Sphaerochaeta sp.]